MGALDLPLARLARGEALRGPLLDAAFAAIMDGQAAEAEITAFLRGTVAQMADPETIAAGARALRARMRPVAAPPGAIDVCGTGGDGAHTLNVSTAVAFIVAGAGAPVAKHGNRAMSSRSGAADVLEALGVRLTADTATLQRCLVEAKVAFLFAQAHHPAMRHVAAARRAIGTRTIFNLLGPLANPAGVRRQLIGVYAADAVAPVAEALRLLEAERAAVVHGAGGLDELSFAPAGVNVVALLRSGSIERVSETTGAWATASFYGVPLAPPSALAGGDAQHNAAALRALLENRAVDSAYEHVALLNATAALVVAGRAEDAKAAWAIARDSLRTGAALGALEGLVALSRNAPDG